VRECLFGGFLAFGVGEVGCGVWIAVFGLVVEVLRFELRW